MIDGWMEKESRSALTIQGVRLQLAKGGIGQPLQIGDDSDAFYIIILDNIIIITKSI